MMNLFEEFKSCKEDEVVEGNPYAWIAIVIIGAAYIADIAS